MPAHAPARGARKVCVGTTEGRAYAFGLCWLVSDRDSVVALITLAVALCTAGVLALVAQQGIIR